MAIRIALPRARQLWRQVHWFVGIAAGTLLIVIGLTGAILSFREELLDAINPGGRQVAPETVPALTPPQLLQAVHAAWGPSRSVGTLTVFAQPGMAARIILAPRAGERRGETVYLNPYTGAELPPLRGAAFFETAEELHRWLLLPREPGRVAAGVLAAALLLLALSGLYVRWPRRALDWRAWFLVPRTLRQRALLSRLHVVAGTCVLPLYLLLTATGIYWSFDAVRDSVDALLGSPRPARAAPAMPRARPMEARAGTPPPAPDITSAWNVFEARAQASGGWSQAILRVSGGTKPSVLFTWLDAAPAHERARNRMTVLLPGAEVTQDERHAAKAAGARALAAIYPLHMGSYFGLPGRIAMLLAALGLPAFAVTGWWLYLDRRAKQRRGRERPLPHAGAGTAS